MRTAPVATVGNNGAYTLIMPGVAAAQRSKIVARLFGVTSSTALIMSRIAKGRAVWLIAEAARATSIFVDQGAAGVDPVRWRRPRCSQPQRRYVAGRAGRAPVH